MRKIVAFYFFPLHSRAEDRPTFGELKGIMSELLAHMQGDTPASTPGPIPPARPQRPARPNPIPRQAPGVPGKNYWATHIHLHNLPFTNLLWCFQYFCTVLQDRSFLLCAVMLIILVSIEVVDCTEFPRVWTNHYGDRPVPLSVTSRQNCSCMKVIWQYAAVELTQCYTKRLYVWEASIYLLYG